MSYFGADNVLSLFTDPLGQLISEGLEQSCKEQKWLAALLFPAVLHSCINTSLSARASLEADLAVLGEQLSLMMLEVFSS